MSLHIQPYRCKSGRFENEIKPAFKRGRDRDDTKKQAIGKKFDEVIKD
jgi:hypothetical protein